MDGTTMARMGHDQDHVLVERQLLAELLLCEDEPRVLQALAAVSSHMVADEAVRLIVDFIRDHGRDPVDIYKHFVSHPAFPRRTLGPYLGELIDSAISGKGVFLSQRARQVVDQYRKRACDQIAKQLSGAVDETAIGSVIAECEDALGELRGNAFHEKRSISDVVASVLESLGKEDAIVPSFGMPGLDRLIQGGMRPGSNTMVGALTSVGKSAFVQAVARNAASDGFRVLLFSCEMTQESVAQRLIIMESGISGSDQQDYQNLSKDRKDSIRRAASVVSELPLEIVYSPGWTVERVEEYCHERNADDKVDLVVIDYLQLLNAGRRCESAEKEVDYISKTLVDMGGKLNCATLVCAQLNDDAEGREPEIRHIRGSKAPGHHADNVLMLSRDKRKDRGEMDVWIKKNRNGPLGHVAVPFRVETYRFGEAAPF